MSCKTDKPTENKPVNESKPPKIKVKVLPQWRVVVEQGKDVEEG